MLGPLFGGWCALLLCTLCAPSAATAQAAATPLTVRDVLERSGIEWRTRTTSHFRFHYQPGTLAERDIDDLVDDAERAREHGLDILGHRDYPRIDIFYLTSREQMTRLIGAHPKALAAPSANFAFFVYNADVRPYHRHEIMHILALNLWGQPARPADWIVEGLGVFAEGTCLEYPIRRVARSMLDDGRLIPLSTLMQDFRRQDDLQAYVQAGSFVEHLYGTYGRDVLHALWTRGTAGFREATGKELGVVALEWRRALAQERQAGRRVDWNRLRREGCG